MVNSLVMKAFLTVLLFIIAAKGGCSDTIRSFETDYCTLFMEGNWGHCCLDHDLSYWVGGSKQEQLQSDLKLKSCVAEAGGEFMGNAIYYAVRAGHYSPVKHKYKWSWGWGDEESFEPLSSGQKAVAGQELRRSNLEEELVERFIQERLQ